MAMLRAAMTLVAVWAGYGIGFYAIGRGFAGSSAPGLLAATGIFAASYVAGYVVLVAPGGLLVREGAMALLLVGVAGAPAPLAAVLAILARLWVTAAEILAFLIAVVAARHVGSHAAPVASADPDP